jgi:hypothetical protein
LNRILKPGQQGYRTVDMSHPEETAEDQFNVKLLPRKQQLQSRTENPNHSPILGGRKRNRGTKVSPLATGNVILSRNVKGALLPCVHGSRQAQRDS